jgi:hypothetical protein
VAGASIVHEGTIDGLNSGCASFIKWLCCGVGGGLLMGSCGSVGGFDSFVRGMLFAEKYGVVEFAECSVDVVWHGDVNIPCVVVPFKREAAVQLSGQIDKKEIV